MQPGHRLLPDPGRRGLFQSKQPQGARLLRDELILSNTWSAGFQLLLLRHRAAHRHRSKYLPLNSSLFSVVLTVSSPVSLAGFRCRSLQVPLMKRRQALKWNSWEPRLVNYVLTFVLTSSFCSISGCDFY